MQEAARAIGVTPSNLTKMLAPTMKMSEHADALADYLEIPRPTVDITSVSQDAWFKLVRRLQDAATPEAEAELLEMFEERIAQFEARKSLSAAEADTLARIKGPERTKK
jgi:hypothetical protein